MSRLELQALLLTSLPAIRYFSGFSGSDGAMVLTSDSVRLLVDARYLTQAQEQATGCTVVCYSKKNDAVVAVINDQQASRVGFESERLTVAMHSALVSVLPDVALVPLAGEVDALRQVKSAAELSHLTATAALASDAFRSILSDIVPGQTEAAVALALEIAMKRAGAEAIAFDFIVASGVRGALPHGRASCKQIAVGELVTIDFGAVCNGYNSDETVTVAVGAVTDRQREVYQIVKEAHDRAIAAVRPGVRMAELDAIARGYITQQGFGDYFGHGLGHGVGLEIHEKPVVNGTSQAVAAEGMVFTIEPGIYIPGWGGVRIEDTVVVTAAGCRVLTTVDKELLVVGA